MSAKVVRSSSGRTFDSTRANTPVRILCIRQATGHFSFFFACRANRAPQSRRPCTRRARRLWRPAWRGESRPWRRASIRRCRRERAGTGGGVSRRDWWRPSPRSRVRCAAHRRGGRSPRGRGPRLRISSWPPFATFIVTYRPPVKALCYHGPWLADICSATLAAKPRLRFQAKDPVSFALFDRLGVKPGWKVLRSAPARDLCIWTCAGA